MFTLPGEAPTFSADALRDMELIAALRQALALIEQETGPDPYFHELFDGPYPVVHRPCSEAHRLIERALRDYLLRISPSGGFPLGVFAEGHS